MARISTLMNTALTYAVKKRPGLMLTCLAFATLMIGARGFFSDDLDQSGDLIYHLACEGQVAQAIKEGRSPFGPLSLNFGTPVLRFYQPFLYLVTGPFQAAFEDHLILIHNLILLLFLGATPFASYFGYRAIGLPEAAAGLATLLAPLSVAGFGNSFEAYFSTGVINQLFGAVFFPIFLGGFALFLRGKSGPIRSSAVFALTFISHAMMAVYAVFAGALLFLTDVRNIRELWKPLLVFVAVSMLAVAFWFVPFLDHWGKHRPVPEPIALHGNAFLSNSVTSGEAIRLLVTGRLLDDAHVISTGNQDQDDKLLDRINMCPTTSTRPPVVTLLTLLGLVLCIVKIRSSAHRFMTTGFIFTFLLLMGPDDVGWITYLPFVKRIEFFRCTYLLEFFAFGLSGAGLQMLFAQGYKGANRLGAPLRLLAVILGGLVSAAGLFYFFYLFSEMAAKHANPGSKAKFERALTVARPAQHEFPERMILQHDHFRTDKRWISYLSAHEMRVECGHWRIIGPTIANNLCSPIRRPGQYLDIAQRVGIGFYLVNRKHAKSLSQLTSDAVSPLMRQVKRGRGHYLYQNQATEYLWAADRPILVVGSATHWFYLSRSWIDRMRRVSDTTAPPLTPILFGADQRLEPNVLRAVDGVVVLVPQDLEKKNLEALASYATSGGNVFSVRALPGVKSTLIDPDGPPLLKIIAGEEKAHQVATELVSARVAGPFVYRVNAASPTAMVLPEFAVDGWRATVDGVSTPIYAGGPNMVTTVVPQGKHTLRLWWQTPTSHWFWFAVSLITWLGIIATGVSFIVRKGKRP